MNGWRYGSEGVGYHLKSAFWTETRESGETSEVDIFRYSELLSEGQLWWRDSGGFQKWFAWILHGRMSSAGAVTYRSVGRKCNSHVGGGVDRALGNVIAYRDNVEVHRKFPRKGNHLLLINKLEESSVIPVQTIDLGRL